jgi:hypothetical protein
MERTLSLSELETLLRAVETVAAVSSRLGHDSVLHRHVCRFLSRSMLDCRFRKATLIVASGTAIEPWAIRAAELFDVKTIRIAIGKDHSDADYFVPLDSQSSQSRDSVVIELANRVDAVYVRAGGTIAKSLARRIEQRRDVNTRIAITPDARCASTDLIAAGAIGWFCSAPQDDPAEDAPTLAGNIDDPWSRTDGQWLVHCTRGPRANWPDETMRQYRDSILIGDQDSTNRQPIDALCRIISSGRLIAASTASSKQYPVVCFSEVSLAELLDRRCFRPQLGRWDYEPYGVAIRRSASESLGIEPVIYGEPEMRGTLSKQNRYRFHPIGKTYDWRTEKEWRSNQTIDLTAIDEGNVRVFAADSAQSRNRLADCRWAVSFITQNTDQCV